MTNRLSSFGLPRQPPPLARGGGRIAARAELPITASGDIYTVEGNTSISRLPSQPSGVAVTLVLLGTPTFVHSSMLICPGAVNLVGAAGDLIVAVSSGDGIWRVYTLRNTPAATETQVETGTDNDRIVTSQGASQAVAANILGFKNVCGRNGGMEVWQRGTSIAVAASTTAYTADGWYLATAANQASVVSRQSGLTNGSRYSARVQRNSGQTGTGLIIFGFPLDTDELKKCAGQSIVLQFWMSSGADWSPASGALGYKVSVGSGTPVKVSVGFTNLTDSLSSSVNLAQGAAAAQLFSAVVAIPATVAALAIAQAEVVFYWTPVGTAGTNDWVQIDDVQVSVVPAGLTAARPAFERSDYAFDLLRCQRFLPVLTSPGAGTTYFCNGFSYLTTQAFFVVPLHVSTRAKISGLTVSAASDFICLDGSAGTHACTAFSLNSAGVDAISLAATVASGFTIGQGASLGFANANAQLIGTGAEI